jgi:predicted pyridoxine 5'-phosphate oxidase superfamily flavin-nucleotide-binding protein
MSRIDEPERLRAKLGKVHELASGKTLKKLDKYAKAYIARSPFLCIGTADAKGKADVSPRGDPPGFVRVIDDGTLIIPDRPGNNRGDTMLNIIANANVGLLFMIPGIEDTVRVNGKAPRLGIRVKVEEVFFHCAKAFKRAKLWDSSTHEDRGFLPPLARIVMEQARACEVADAEAEAVELEIQEEYRTQLY